MDQPPAVAFTAIADMSPRGMQDRDMHDPITIWHGKDFNF